MNGRPHGRILVADDHDLMRLALREDLERGGFAVCAEASTGASAIDAALRERPDLCLLDVNMPEGGGIEAAVAIKRELPETKILLITADPGPESEPAVAESGADGCVGKDLDPSLLPAVAAAVLAGEPLPALPGRLHQPVVKRSEI